MVRSKLIIAFKLIICLIIPALSSCNTSNRKIISKWNDGTTKVERIYSDPASAYVEKEYYENGQLETETRFADSIKNGLSLAYYRNGQLLGSCIYRNGKINGEVSEFHNNGNIMFKATQVDGALVGKAVHYYGNGKLQSEFFYKDNKVFLTNYWDSSGLQQIENGNGTRRFSDLLSKDVNGKDTIINVTVVGIYKDSLHNGLWKYYNVLDKRLVLERKFIDDKIVSEKWQ